MSESYLDQIKSLHTHAVDARNGYQEALADAGGKGLTSLFQQMIGLHSRHADELARQLAKFGVVEDGGSFMSTVHRTIMSIRSLFGGLDQSVIPGLIDGEERNVASYREALSSASLPKVVQETLAAQLSEIESAIATMRGLA